MMEGCHRLTAANKKPAPPLLIPGEVSRPSNTMMALTERPIVVCGSFLHERFDERGKSTGRQATLTLLSIEDGNRERKLPSTVAASRRPR